jgi:hypothetical protein
VNERGASDGLVVDLAVRGADRVTHTAICPACGYPKVGLGLCAYCRVVPVL